MTGYCPDKLSVTDRKTDGRTDRTDTPNDITPRPNWPRGKNGWVCKKKNLAWPSQDRTQNSMMRKQSAKLTTSPMPEASEN